MIDLEFNRVSKRYRIKQERDDLASRNPVVRKIQGWRKETRDFWALRDVSFEVPTGQALGIIGHNGAGKSTLLKLLSNITAPSEGEMKIRGRLSALIEVGSGFHPELTGRENIYLNGSILGMRRREISEKFDRIVDFAGVRQFIDTPVKRYSSGMYVRLGFSIAAHLDPDILLLDEVLAVGDAAFQSKCIRRIRELKELGTTIVFISHDLGAVERLCDRVLLARRGQIVADGPPIEVIAEYQRAATDISVDENGEDERTVANKRAEVTTIEFFDTDGNEQISCQNGGSIVARVNYLAREPIEDAVFELFFYSGEGKLTCQLSTEWNDRRIDLQSGAGKVEFLCAEIGLRPGIYFVDATIKQRGGLEDIDWQRHGASLRIDPGKLHRGEFYMPHEWRVTRLDGVTFQSKPELAFASRDEREVLVDMESS